MCFFCDVCVEVFTSEQQLNVHLARHAAPGELECGTCLRVYGSREELATHLCIEYRESYVCCAKDWRHHRFYNRHVFIEHGVKTNARVRMQPGQLFGKIRMARVRNGEDEVECYFFNICLLCCRKERRFVRNASRSSRAARESNIWRPAWELKLLLCS